MTTVTPTTSTLPATTMAGCSAPPPTLPPTTTATPTTTAPAGTPDLAAVIAQLQTVTQQLTALVDALQGQQQLTPATAPGSTAVPQVPTATPTAPTASAASGVLAGFSVSGDAAEQAALSTALQQIGGTTLGAPLLQAVSGKGVQLDIVSDAEYAQRTGGTATDAVAVFMSSSATQPTVLVRASKLDGNSTTLPHVLAHELTHAAQYLGGEGVTQYAQGLGTAASGLTAAQLQVGATLMKESGAEVVASAIDAQLQYGTGFHLTETNLRAVADQGWKTVNAADYNPAGYTLPQYVSPWAMGLARSQITG